VTARGVAPEAQEAIATAKFIRMSPTKVRQVVDLIRDRHIDDARRVLQFSQRAAAAPVRKLLESAVANAEHNRGLPTDELVVQRAWVDEGPTLKRYRPRALGRATRIRKRTSHISIVVGRPAEAVVEVRRRSQPPPASGRGARPSDQPEASARRPRRRRAPSEATAPGEETS
jgi:large subunit ribosomal protein L22